MGAYKDRNPAEVSYDILDLELSISNFFLDWLSYTKDLEINIVNTRKFLIEPNALTIGIKDQPWFMTHEIAHFVDVPMNLALKPDFGFNDGKTEEELKALLMFEKATIVNYEIRAFGIQRAILLGIDPILEYTNLWPTQFELEEFAVSYYAFPLTAKEAEARIKEEQIKWSLPSVIRLFHTKMELALLMLELNQIK